MNSLPKLKPVTESQKKRPKILLLSDDMFTTSGIATMSYAFVAGTADKFNWVQIGAAINHTMKGQVFDVSQQIAESSGVKDASVKIYPNDGYGNPELLRTILELEKPDAILHFTDPRFWDWLYQMEHEIHNKWNIPICYYAIWDNFPYPYWNAPAYSSCDLIMGISKQSHLIHNTVLKYAGKNVIDLSSNNNIEYKPGDVFTSYVPHGINKNQYFPITEEHADWKEFSEFKKEFQSRHKFKFLVYWTNRNIRRKNPSDLIHAFSLFWNKLPEDKRSEVALLMHTAPVDPNGTDLIAVKKMVAPDCNIIFSPNKIPIKHMNFYYNIADITVNIASNEGFGLSSAESLMAGTPVINNVTGGLQDQMGFIDDRTGKLYVPDEEVTSNHRGRFKKHGKWAFPIFPSNISMQGSPQTPYIFDDRVDAVELSDILIDIFTNFTKDELKHRGALGREWMLGESNMNIEAMSEGITNGINTILKFWKGGVKYTFEKVSENKNIQKTGITI